MPELLAGARVRQLVNAGRNRDSESPGDPRGAYVHIPFCFHKCHYCDFYSLVDLQDRQETFVDRLIDEFQIGRTFLAQPLETLFFGGGTPTLLRVELWTRLLAAVHESLPLADQAEFTVEANPETVTSGLAAALVAGGVNRISIGVQSFNLRHLQTLERWHDPANVRRSVGILRDAGIRRINLDLIFGVPGQTIADWERDLDAALALKPDHVSCYGLTYEPNTPLTRRRDLGRITPIDEGIEAAMYERTIDRLGEAGFEHYEISAWARPGERCRHNLLYWTGGNWWPFGPAATGQAWGVRWRNVPRLTAYLASTSWPPVCDVEEPDDATRLSEALMLGFRLIAGFDAAELDALISQASDAPRRREAVRRHLQLGFLKREDGGIRLSRRGLLVADTVIAELI